MKSLLITPLLIFLFTFSVYSKNVEAMANNCIPAMTEETYVNDIPFNTFQIAGEEMLKNVMHNFPDEADVKDIPFNTRKIALESELKSIMAADEEAYVDDIPFSTKKIFYNSMVNCYTQNFRDEDYVNDIPFNTTELACQYLLNNYRDEKPVNDIRFDTYTISNNYQFQTSVKDYRNEANTKDLPPVMCDPICRLTSNNHTIHIRNSYLMVESPQIAPEVLQFDEEMIRIDLEHVMQKLNDWEVKLER